MNLVKIKPFSALKEIFEDAKHDNPIELATILADEMVTVQGSADNVIVVETIRKNTYAIPMECVNYAFPVVLNRIDPNTADLGMRETPHNNS